MLSKHVEVGAQSSVDPYSFHRTIQREVCHFQSGEWGEGLSRQAWWEEGLVS